MNGVVRFALGLARMPESEIADLDQKLPGLARIAAAAKEIEPLLRQAEPHAEALAPLLNQMLPIIKGVWPDIVAVAPTIEQLIAFVNTKN